MNRQKSNFISIFIFLLGIMSFGLGESGKIIKKGAILLLGDAWFLLPLVMIFQFIFKFFPIKIKFNSSKQVYGKKVNQEEFSNETVKIPSNFKEVLDPMFEEILKFTIDTGKISASLLQRRFRLGYDRAARLVDQLENFGVIGPANGAKPREVLVNDFTEIVFDDFELDIKKSDNINENKESDNTSYNHTRTEGLINFMKEKFDITSNYKNDGQKLNLFKNSYITNHNDNLTNLLEYLIKENTPLHLKLVLLDTRITTFMNYKFVPHLLVPVFSDLKKSSLVLEKLVAEMNNRYELLLKNNYKNIKQYNDNVVGEKIPYIFTFIYDINDVIKFQDANVPLQELIRLGESVGIILLLSSSLNRSNVNLGKFDGFINNMSSFQLNKIISDVNEFKDELNEIDQDLDGFQFEEKAKELLIKNGFEYVEVTKQSNDYGVDIIAFKDDIKYSIQCKKQIKPVGVSAVQEVIASKSMTNAHVAVVFTNNTFTKQAKILAEKNKVLLWDRSKLKELLNSNSTEIK